MATDKDLPTTGMIKGKTTTLPPTRNYEIPGGPFARNLAPTTTKILAEFERGGPDDNAR